MMLGSASVSSIGSKGVSVMCTCDYMLMCAYVCVCVCVCVCVHVCMLTLVLWSSRV